jgi:hypothetical protein
MSRNSLLAFTIILASAAAIGWTTMNFADDSEAEGERLLRHVVCFKFKADATEEQIQHVADEFALLPSRIDTIVDFEWGINNSPEDHAKGFTHCFVVTFRDEAGREEYLPHPAHNDFVAIVGPVVEDVFVIDYWTP